MELTQHYFTNNDCYKANQRITVKGLMLHSTGVNNPNLSRYVPAWNVPKPDGRQVAVHGFIGKKADGNIATYQTLPWDMRAWHCGGSANNTHIGVEICEGDLNDGAYFAKVYKEAVELFTFLCKQFKLTEKNIICHSEGYKLGVASNHADVMHWFPKHGKSMDTFRADVKAGLAVKPVAKPAPVAPKPVVKPAPATPKFQLVYARILVQGTKGTDVKQLQTALNSLFYKCGTPDGIFGPATTDAVKRFQSVYLPHEVDGIAGKATIAKINSLLK